MMTSNRLAVLVLCLVASVSAGAQSNDPALRSALSAAEAGQLDFAQAARFSRDPLYPWLQAAVARQQIRSIPAPQMHAVLGPLGSQPAGQWLRTVWLGELIRREDWRSFQLDYRPSDDVGLRCADLRARMAAGTSGDASWRIDAQQVWLQGKSLPASCDAVSAEMQRLGQLDDALRWQRIDLAVDAGEPALIRAISRSRGADAAREAQAQADYIAAPTDGLPGGRDPVRTGTVITEGLSRLARRDPARARLLLAQVPAGTLSATQRGRVAYQVALWTVASYLPDSAERLNAVPAAAYDDKLHEWRAREAMSRRDDAAALSAITQMPTLQRNDSRWTYFEARLRERLGQSDAARKLYQNAALSPGFHGWLASDRLGIGYALCALEPRTDSGTVRRVADDPGLGRALRLFRLDRHEWATREWTQATQVMNDDQRRVAVQRAIAAGWFDRAVFGMGKAPDDTRHYSLRFPLHHEDAIRQHAGSNSLDPAWVAGQTRAESSFMPKARSSADARGLMQLLPGTGALTARRLGLPWLGAESLYEPTTNIRLGTAYMRQMLDRFSGLPYVAIAAYNAGPAPVERWRAARGQLEPDFFIESIPYKETREYVARVLSFSVVYDWRLNGTAAPLSERMLGRLATGSTKRRPFSCPATTNSQAPDN